MKRFKISLSAKTLLRGVLPDRKTNVDSGSVHIVGEKSAPIDNEDSGWNGHCIVNFRIGNDKTIFFLPEGSFKGAYDAYLDALDDEARAKALPFLVDGKDKPLEDGVTEGYINPKLTGFALKRGALVYQP